MEHETTLSDIIQYLKPPQQDYQRLARELAQFRIEPKNALGRIIQAYFSTFGNGYDFWQANYEYPRVHEYFYGAYLVAADEIEQIKRSHTGTLDPIAPDTLRRFFENMSLAFVNNTLCENAMLCNVPRDLLIGAQEAARYADKALELLEGLETDWPEEHKDAFDHIRTYLQMNRKLYKGYEQCAILYLLRWSEKVQDLDSVPQITEEIKTWLESLKPDSRELFSELRTHLITSTRLMHDYQAGKQTSLHVQQADLYLRVTAYAGSHLTKPLFEIFNDKETGGPEVLKQKLADYGLAADDAHTGGFLDDSLETTLAVQIGDRIVFDFPAGEEDSSISIYSYDGNQRQTHHAETISVEVSRQGNVSVVISFNLENISMSHLRFMNALLAPHIGSLDIIWHAVPIGSAEDASTAAFAPHAEAINYVQNYLACFEWCEDAKKRDAIPDSERDTLDTIVEPLQQLKDKLLELAKLLRTAENPVDEDPTHPDKIKHTTLLDDVFVSYENLRACFQQWGWLQAESAAEWTPRQREMQDRARKLFPPEGSQRYIKLIDICSAILVGSEEVEESEGDQETGESKTFRGFKGYLEKLAQEKAEPVDTSYDYDQWQFDPNLGWQSIVVANQLAIRTVNEQGCTYLEPLSEEEQNLVLDHPEFKGFTIGRQEVGGLDDWMYTIKLPGLRNLAYVRSHDKDVVYVGPNMVCLYMINNPQFLVDVTLDVVRLVGDLRALVMAYHANTRQVVKELSDLLEKHPNKPEMMHFRQKMLRWEREVTLFFELIRELPISRYQDHADLMREMLKDSGINDWCSLLQESIAALDNLFKITEE